MGTTRFLGEAMFVAFWLALTGLAWPNAALATTPDGDEDATSEQTEPVHEVTWNSQAEAEPLLFPPPALLLRDLPFTPLLRDEDYPDVTLACRERNQACLNRLLTALRNEVRTDEARALRFQAAKLAFDLSRNDTALDLFTSLLPQADILADTVEFHLAELAFRRNDHEESLRRCKAVGPTSRFHGRCRLRAAQSLSRLKRLDEARALLEEMRETPPSGVSKDTMTWELADVLWRQKQRNAAKPLLRELWRSSPKGAFETEVQKRLDAFPAPGYETLVEDCLARTEALHKVFRYSLAQKELEIAQNLLTDEQDSRSRVAGRVKLWSGMTQFRLRSYSNAIDLFTEALSCDLSKEDQATARFMILDAYSRKSQYGKVHAAAKTFLAKHADHSEACNVLYLDATAYRSEEKTKQAVERYRETARRFPDCDLTDDALWFAAWALYRGGELDEAMKTLEELAHAYPGGFVEQQAVYWLGRCHQDREETDKAALRFRDVWTRWPLSFYGTLSLWRLNELKASWPKGVVPKENLKNFPLEQDLELEISYLAADRHVRRGLELLRLGLKNDAVAEFSAIDRDALDEADQVKLDWLLTVAYHRVGDLYRSHFIPRLRREEFAAGLPVAPRRSFWKLAYPHAYGDLTEKYGKAFDIDPLFVMAIMREESGFHPQIESPANAVGLTQIIASTGRRIARKLGVKRFSLADLKDPETAIRFGAFHLKELLDRWDGKVPLAIGSYNAGEGAVARWVKKNGDLPFDVWLEEIPYRETRNYTRRVLKTYGIYRYLYTDEQIAPDLPKKAGDAKSHALKIPVVTPSDADSVPSDGNTVPSDADAVPQAPVTPPEPSTGPEQDSITEG